MSVTYLMGGLLGDFIHQLYIVYEHWIKTGQRGHLYFSDRGDCFRRGVESTMKDLHCILKLQPYIESWSVYQNEPYDIDCIQWRYVLGENNMWGTYDSVYNIEWGRDRWLLNIPTDLTWSGKVVVNTTDYRFPKLNFNMDMIFCGFEKRQYDIFVEKTKLNIKYYQVESLFELCVIINSCDLYVGSWSAPLSICHALHHPCEVEYHDQLSKTRVRNVKYIK